MPSNVAVHMTVLVILLLLSGCASAPAIETPGRAIVWPRPPDKARIRFLKSLSKVEDLGAASSGLAKRFWTFLAGETVTKDLLAPYGVTVDKEGNAYVADRDSGEIISFNLRSRKWSSFYFETKGVEDSPLGIGVAEYIYVSYPDSRRVLVFDKNGKAVTEIGKGADFQRPTGIAVNADKGLLYVADTLDHDIKVFDPDGKPLFKFGSKGEKDGEFNYPTHIFAAKDGVVYVTDELNFRIQAFTSDGRFLFKFGKQGMVPGTFQSPKGVTVDGDGNIYVADAMADGIQIFNKEGRLLLSFGGSGSEDGQFWGPTGMFIDGDDRIYVTDLYNSRVQVFQYLKEK